MAIILDATIGGASSNSYLTVDRSDVLAETLPHMGEWFTDESINKAQLLLHATRLIDRQFRPSGAKVSSSQALWWPQSGLIYDGTSTAIPTTVIPEFVETATLEWAWALHLYPDVVDSIVPGIRVLDTPSYKMEFTGDRGISTPSVVSDLLGPYSVKKLRSFVRVVRT